MTYEGRQTSYDWCLGHLRILEIPYNQPTIQCPFQVHKLEVPTRYKAYVRAKFHEIYLQLLLLYVLQYLQFTWNGLILRLYVIIQTPYNDI